MSMVMDISHYDGLGMKDLKRSIVVGGGGGIVAEAAAGPPQSSISASLTERMRRSIMGEIVGDLHTLLMRSKTVIAASGQVIGNHW